MSCQLILCRMLVIIWLKAITSVNASLLSDCETICVFFVSVGTRYVWLLVRHSTVIL